MALLTMFFSSGDLILQLSLCLSLTIFFSFFKIPAFFLQGLYTYVHPDDVTPNNSTSRGVTAAIRRPGTSDSELKPRKKSKGKYEFDENKAQIFRLRLNHAHLHTRVYFKQFNGAFNSTFIVLPCLLLHKFYRVSEDSGRFRIGSVIPFLLGFAGICRLLLLVAKLSFERSASKKSEKLVSVIMGFIGFFLGLPIVYGIVPKWVLDFDFDSLRGFEKFSVAVYMGCIMGLFYMPATRYARAFWLGTDQLRSNLSIISCGWIERLFLFANYFLLVFTSTLWIRPLADLLINKNIIDVTNKSHLYGRELAVGIGMPQSHFDKLRLWCLLGSGILQMLSVRPNLQMFLNEAVLCWYQRLHGSKVPDLDYSRAKVFLHNHYMCAVLVQFFAPAAMVLIFLGLSQFGDSTLTDLGWLCDVLPCSVFVSNIVLFLAWWAIFVLALFSTMALVLYRQGVLYIS